MGFVFEFDAKNNVLRGTIKDRPETMRLSDEIMKLLIKRQTILADGSDALTTVMLNALKAIKDVTLLTDRTRSFVLA